MFEVGASGFKVAGLEGSGLMILGLLPGPFFA